jgi:response regulator RpfG family c-di-GMP phosphodiesterase
LLVCKEIIDLHDGSIDISSKENEGASISFTLPKAFPNILIISDNKDNSDYLKNIISEFFIDFKTIVFENVLEAEKIFVRPEFSLLIYDKNDVPEENDTFFEIINRNQLVKIVPTVLFISNANQDILESYLSNGIDFIISKPFEENLIVDTFTKILFGLLSQS